MHIFVSIMLGLGSTQLFGVIPTLTVAMTFLFGVIVEEYMQ